MSATSSTPAAADKVTEQAVRSALSTAPRPPRPSALGAALTFGWRGMLKVKHVPEQLRDVTITPVMFVLMFTYLFGGAIAGSTGAYLDYSGSARCRSGVRRRWSARCSATASATCWPVP